MSTTKDLPVLTIDKAAHFILIYRLLHVEDKDHCCVVFPQNGKTY